MSVLRTSRHPIRLFVHSSGLLVLVWHASPVRYRTLQYLSCSHGTCGPHTRVLSRTFGCGALVYFHVGAGGRGPQYRARLVLIGHSACVFLMHESEAMSHLGFILVCSTTSVACTKGAGTQR